MASMRRSCSSASGVAPSMPETLTIPGQAGAQHHFPHPEKHQNRIPLPHHLHDLRTERGIEEVAESVGGGREESPSPQAVPAAGEPTISMTALLELLKNADPEVKAQLRLALLT